MTHTPMENPAEHWRVRALQARAEAERQTDPELRRQLLEIADGYDQLASLAGQRDDQFQGAQRR